MRQAPGVGTCLVCFVLCPASSELSMPLRVATGCSAVREVGILRRCRRREARACLTGVELVMTDDPGDRIALLQQTEHLMQHLLLGLRPRVLGLALLVQASLVAHAYRVRVEALDVATDHRYRAAVVHRPVSPHIDVVPGMLSETSQLMASDQ